MLVVLEDPFQITALIMRPFVACRGHLDTAILVLGSIAVEQAISQLLSSFQTSD